MAARHRRANSLHFKTRRRKVPIRLLAVVAVVIVVLAGAAVARAATVSVPRLQVRSVLPASVRFPGSPVAPAWPASGQAAVEVAGVGGLGTSGPSTPVPVASLAKVMTAYVILQDHPLAGSAAGPAVTISAADVADYRSRLAQGELVTPVAEGESLSELQLLEGILVASSNNLAAIAADFDAGSTAAFVSKMNATARTLGMSHTTYADATGVSSGTVSTAGDQLRLESAAMQNDVFGRVVAMTSIELPVAGTVANFNRSVGTGGYIGIKTGSGTGAGGCLMFANRQVVSGRPYTIVGVVLGQAQGQQSTSVLTSAALAAADALVRSVQAAVSVDTLLPARTRAAVVTNAQGHRVTAVTKAAVEAVGWGGLELPVKVTVSPLGTTVAAGGTVAQVAVAGGQPQQVRAAASAPVPSVSFGWRLRHLF